MGEYRKHMAGYQKSGMGKRQKRKILFLLTLLVLFLLVLGVFLIKYKNEDRISERDLTLKQLSSFMSFYEYDEQQWFQYMQELDMQEHVSWDELELYLKNLGVKDYLDYDRPKADRVVTYGEFQPLYEQILSLLDPDDQVTEQTITIEKVSSDHNEWESGTLVSDGKDYQVVTGIQMFRKGLTCSLYLLDHKILGIVKIIGGKSIEKLKTQDFSFQDKDTVTVLLKNADAAYRKKVYLLFEGDYTKTEVNGKEKKLESGYLLKLTNCKEEKEPKEEQYMRLKPADDSGRIYFADQTGKKLSEGYRGDFRIYRYPQGYVVVNVLSIREYLYGVVPSEMPSSYEEEALKAQAVCARSYTYKHLEQKGNAGFYSDLDDSVQYQVYNKSKDSEKTRKAVDETLNQVLVYQGDLAVTYYYSTSCGITQGYDLWELDGADFGYIHPQSLHEDGEEPFKELDLSKEEDFRAFLDLDTDGFYEKDCRYFRWKATLNYKNHAEALKRAVMQRKKAAAKSVKIRNENGKTVSDTDGLGNPEKILAKSRSIAGGITCLLIQFEHGTVELNTEYTIRYCLGACSPTVRLADENSVTMQSLPSACFVISSQKNGKMVLSGGGFGHGLGMSQNGADKLAQTGWNYQDILLYFYQDTELVNTLK
ncbi:MAG: SpoIID/LytB domain-containing protein [Lachnospiraceae bacterium]